MQPFASSLEHLLAEMECVDLLIRARVAAFRASQIEDEQFRGLYVSEQQVDTMLATPLGMPAWLLADPVQDGELVAKTGALARQLAARRRLSLSQGVDLRLENLRSRFGLDDTDICIVLMCLAVDLDSRYERLYAYLQDDVTRIRPGIELVLALLEPDPVRRIAARTRLAPDAPLRLYRIVEIVDDATRPSPAFAGRFLRVDERISTYLLGEDQMDGAVAPYLQLAGNGRELASLILEDDTRHGLVGLVHDTPDGRNMVIHLRGPAGAGKRTIALALCHARHLPLIVVEVDALLAAGSEGLATKLWLIGREARLAGAALYWNGFDAMLGDERRGLLQVLLHTATVMTPLTFLAGDDAWRPGRLLRRLWYIDVRIAQTSIPKRLLLWRELAAAHGADPAALDLENIATKFRFTPGQIEDSIRSAESIARWRDAESPRMAPQDLYDGCRLNSNRMLNTLAQKIVPRFGWSDIVLPEDRLAQLREICNHIKYRNRVFHEWGFDQKLATSRGLTFLFAGPSGTGKTMAAGIIAGELGLDLYRIDLSLVISKFIGETEKNLSRIFDEAETANSILFFDEADSLFGKRSEVKDSHDRYANIEVGHLLQRIEEYEGIAILATNFRRNMDEAFVRRLQFTVDFPLPNETDRLRMWVGILPEAMPRESALDLPLMARRYNLSGGNIRNVALAAAFLAADDGGRIRTSHLIAATQREYQKMGKLMGDGDFEYASGLNGQKQGAEKEQGP